MLALVSDSPWVQFLGRLHPMVLHLPIGLWLGLAALEFGGAIIRRRAPGATMAALAWFAAVGGALAAGAGWLLAREDYSGGTLELHRWLGVSAAAIGVLAAATAGLQSRPVFRVLLLAELGTLLGAGHFGSKMTHGDDWLFEPFAPPPAAAPRTPAPAPVPDQAQATGTTPPTAATTAATPADAAATAPLAATFATAIQPILQQRCSKCHGESKQKAELALHTQASIELGGENGPVLLAGKPDESPMLVRLQLPLDDEDHMPPPKEKQPTAHEIATLRAWIAAGAPFTGPFAVPEEPTPVDPAPAIDAPATAPAGSPPPDASVEPTPAGSAPGTRGGQDALVTSKKEVAATDAASPAIATPTPVAATAAVQALRQRLVHVAPVPEAADGLWIDFAPVAATMTGAEARTLLQPVAAAVVDLGLARVPAGDDLLQLCARMPRLQRLDLRRTQVTARGLASLTGLERLQHLVLAETRLDDSAVDTLLQMRALRTVHVWHAGLSDAAIARLRQRRDLEVDSGDAASQAPLDVEPPPFADVKALRPVNDLCPVTQKPVDGRFVVVHERRAIGFCCSRCPTQFWAEPAKFPVAAR